MDEKAPRAPRGKIELSTRKMIRAMKLEGTEEQKMLIEQAIAGARIMDEAMTGDRKRYIVSTGHRLQREALAGLRASQPPPPPPAPPVAVDDPRDDLTLWIAAIHRGSLACQDTFPLVMPGACQQCDAAVMARALYGRRHPEIPRHEYGFSSADCGCQKCAAEAAAAGES